MSITKILRLFVPVLLCMIISAPAYAATTYHVTVDGTSDNDGLTWETPMDIKTALGAASAGDEIWVAKGRYAHVAPMNSFEIKDDFALYGGFAGNETNRDERNWLKNETVLSGSSYHTFSPVAAIIGVTNAVFDGFTVTLGIKDDSGGGGLHIKDSRATVANCIFNNNSAGVTISGSTTAIENSTFGDNTPQGGMFIRTSDVTLSNNTFYKNDGGITIFTGNLTVVGCTFLSNKTGRSGAFGKDIAARGASTGDVANLTIANSIFWNYTDTDKSNINVEANSSMDIHNSVIKSDGITGSGTVNKNALHEDDPQLEEHKENDRIYAYIPKGDSVMGNGFSVGTHAINGVTIMVPPTDQLGKSRAKRVDIGSCQAAVVWVGEITMPITLKLEKGDVHELVARVKPDNATDKSLTWTSTNPAVVEVSDGWLLAIGKGNVNITATANDGSKKFAVCAVKVNDAVTVKSITLDHTYLTMPKGGAQQLNATVEPANATDKSVMWKSGNEAIAKVSGTGLVSAIGPGATNVTSFAQDESGKYAVCAVTVNNEDPVHVTGVTLSSSEMNLTIGSSGALTATVWPQNASDKSVTWESSNIDVVSVSQGVVTAHKAGSARVTLKTRDGGKTASCAVTVLTNPPQPVKPAPEKPSLPSGTPAGITAAKPDIAEVSPDATAAQKALAIARASVTMVGIPRESLEVSAYGQVTARAVVVVQVAEEALKAAKLSVDTVIPLPVYVAKPAAAGGVVVIAFDLKGSDFKAKNPENVHLLKIVSGGKGQFFTYASRPAEFGDRIFTVQDMRGNIFTGTFEKDTHYKLLMFVKDGAFFDVDSMVNTSVTDPAALVGTKASPVPPVPTPHPHRSYGGCSAGWGSIILLALCPLALILWIENQES